MNDGNASAENVTQPLRVLLIEDSPRDAEIVVRELRRSHPDLTWKRVETAVEMQAALDAEAWAVVISDYRMPNFDGLSALRLLQETGLDIPFIIVSGTIGEDLAVAAMKAGAHDYLMKNHLARLVPAVQRELLQAVGRREHKGAEKALRASEALVQQMTSAIDDVLYGVDGQTGEFQYLSPVFKRAFGYDSSDIRNMGGRVAFLSQVVQGGKFTQQQQGFQELLAGHAPAKTDRWESWWRCKDGTLKCIEDHWIPVYAAGRLVSTYGVLRDVTGRKHLEDEREVTVQLLGLLNSTTSTRELIQQVTLLLREFFDCEAVGIRLQDGHDFPYLETSGFPPAFVRLENQLCRHDANGQPILDGDGNPALECMCGNVLCGRFNPDKPFFTKRGSFWANDTTRLLATTTAADLLAPTRNRCNGEGYESVALVALRVGPTTFGLIQLNDKRQNRFTPERIALLERLADSLAIGIAQRQDQARLRESEERYRQLFDNANDAIMVHRLSPEGEPRQFVEINQSACHQFGYSREELLRMSPLDIIQPLGEEQHRVIIKGLLENRAVIFEANHVTKDKRLLPVEVSLHTFQHGEEKLVLAIVRDLSARKQAEETLRASEEIFATAFRSSPGGIALLTLDGRYVEVNAVYCSMLGYAREEMIGQTAVSLGLTTAAEREREMLEFERGGSSTKPLEMKLRRRDGSFLDVLFTNAVVKLRGIPHRIGTIINITARKQAEAEIQRLAMAVEQATETIVITDTKATILYINPAFEKITGYTRQEALGQNPRILQSGKQEAAFYRQLWDTLTRGEVWHGHFINKRKDGTLYEEDATISPIRDAAGTITNYVAIKLDVTHAADLEQQLRQAQKMEAVGQLAGGVAHDFNNILQTLLGTTELLLSDKTLPTQHRPDVQEIQRSGLRAANLTRQLLTFSRRQIISLVPLDLNDSVAGLQIMLRRLIGEDIQIVTELEARLPLVKADAGQMEQVIVNLAVNARDAMPEGGRLTISTRRITFDAQDAGLMPDARAGAFVCLAVADTGTGMSNATLAHIFEPFFSTKEPGKGTGLGLSVIYGIAKQHHGWVEVYSQENQGSTFKVYLPVTAEAAAAKKATPEPPRGHGERILLIEDELNIRNLALRVLRNAGYAVQAAGSAAEGLALFKKEQGRFDLLFSDVVLPDQNGVVTAQQLRQQKPELPVLLCSGYSDERSRWAAIEIHHFHFLQKPYPVADLLRTIHDLLAAPPGPPP